METITIKTAQKTIKYVFGRGEMQKNILIKFFLVLAMFYLIPGNIPLFPCTVAVVSGKATQDGRPLLWKNRDTTAVANKLIFLRGERFNYVGLINTKDEDIKNVWAGINTEGFAIMNSLSTDLAERMSGYSQNGILMKHVLGICADVHEFEEYLQNTNGERKVAANFGVIDALGNACFFETSASGYEKFDANDPRFAPQGYIIRTNYAYTAPQINRGGGYIRFERATRLFQTAYAEGRLNTKFILQEAARDMVNEKLHSYPFHNNHTETYPSPVYINTNDTINRNSSVSVVLFHGAASKDKAYMATMWVLLGQPVCTVAVPLWAHAEEVPKVLGGPGSAPLNDLAISLAAYLYPDQRGHMKQYMNLTRFLQYRGTGVIKKIFSIENRVLDATTQKLVKWEKKKPGRREISKFEKEMADLVFRALQKSFPDIGIKEE
jgi:hypothetical protein